MKERARAQEAFQVLALFCRSSSGQGSRWACLRSSSSSLLDRILFMPDLTGSAAVSSPLTARLPGTDTEFRDTSRCILGAVV